MKNNFNYSRFLLLCLILEISLGLSILKANGGSKLLLPPPPTPTVTVITPTGISNQLAACRTSLIATGCNPTDEVRWYQGTLPYSNAYTIGNTITVDANSPVILKAACYDAATNTIGNFSPEYKAVSYIYTEVSPAGTICPGTSPVTLNASSAFSGLTYQWQKNGTNISGATNSTYVPETSGTYSVVAVNNNCGTYSSSSAPLGKGIATIAVDNSVSTSLTGTCGSQSLTLTATVTTYDSYQWKLNGVAISGATSATYTKTSPVPEGTYTCDIVSGTCTFSTQPYYFTPSTAPTVTFNPSILISCTTTVTATGCSGTVYWYKNGSTTSEGTSTGNSPYILNYANLPTDTYTAKCSYGTSTCLSPASNSVTVSPHLSNTVTASATTICPGTSTATLTVSSTYTGLTYAWLLNNAYIAGATASTYTPTKPGTYQVGISRLGCNIFSAPTVITGPSDAVTASFSGTCGSQSMTLTAASSSYTSYQWKLNGVAISGATAYNYVKASPVPEGTYTCDIVSGACSFTTQPYTFAPSTAPTITFSAAVAPSCYPTATATGCSGTVYWYKNGSATFEGTSSGNNPYSLFYSTSNTDTYTAKCSYGIGTSICYSPASNSVTMNLNLYTSVATPSSTFICPNTPVTLTANSTFTGISYQWQKNNLDIPGPHHLLIPLLKGMALVRSQTTKL